MAFEHTLARVEVPKGHRVEPIAVIGMACHLPGGANTPEALWELLCGGDDTCTSVPPERWTIDRYNSTAPTTPDWAHTARGHFLDMPVDEFDARFFGISAREAARLDPQQRQLLEVSWEALEDAGLDPSGLHGSRTAIFTGISNDEYAQTYWHSGRLDLIDGYALTGACFAFAAGRVSSTFGFEGPSVAVDTAGSSSLVAVHLACQSLRDGEADLALASGVNLILSPVLYVASSKLGTLSPDGLCKTFDARADGYGRGEGCGVIVLKRLADAQAQGDRILAVIRGSAVNHGGKRDSLTTPVGLAQERVIRAALECSGLAAGEISYIEVHGASTALGDSIEVEAIGRVMENQRSASTPVILGTVKSNIGHLEAAGGMAGLIKAIQCLRHGEIPPHLHLENPSPHIPWDRYPVRVVTEQTPWPAADQPRRAGVSSFSFSGTNAHVVVESAQAVATPHRREQPCLLPLSARSPEALRKLAERWVAWLSQPAGALADACATAGIGRCHMTHRIAVLGTTPEDFIAALQSYLEHEPGRNVAIGNKASGRPKIAMLFTGQGSQYIGMGRLLYATEPVFRDVVHKCDLVLRTQLGRSIRDLLYADDAREEELQKTRFAQPAIFMIEVALYRLWESWGIQADVVCGHSVGEYAAAHVAGILNLDEALTMVAERGRLMQQLPAGGAMAAVFGAASALTEMLHPDDGISLAAVNTPEDVVVSGPEPAIDDLLRRLNDIGFSGQKLRVSHAFHSSLMRPIVPVFEAIAATRSYGAAKLPVVSSMTGRKFVPGDLASARYWAEQIEAPVQFAAAAQILAADGVDVFLEVGPTPILASFARQNVPTEGRLFLGSLVRPGGDDRRQLLESLSRLYARGAEIRWSKVWRATETRKISVPLYPFQRKSYYTRPNADGAAVLTDNAHPYLGQTIRSPILPCATVLYQAVFSADRPAFLREHQIYGTIISPAAAHLSMAFAGAPADGHPALKDVAFTEPLVIQPGRPRIVQLAVEGEWKWGYRLISQQADQPTAPWIIHSTGRIAAAAIQPSVADLDAIRCRLTGGMAREVFYALIDALGYNIGPDFQCIREIHQGDGETLSLIEAEQPIDARAIHPGLIDSLMQTVLLACEACTAQMRASNSILMPLHMAGARLFGVLDEPLHCHTRATMSGDLVKAQITAYNARGGALMEFSDCLLKLTDQTTLYRGLRHDDRT
jgi:acyl transferase domain-containing protein